MPRKVNQNTLFRVNIATLSLIKFIHDPVIK